MLICAFHLRRALSQYTPVKWRCSSPSPTALGASSDDASGAAATVAAAASSSSAMLEQPRSSDRVRFALRPDSSSDAPATPAWAREESAASTLMATG